MTSNYECIQKICLLFTMKNVYLTQTVKCFSLFAQLERSFKFMRETEDQLKVIPQFCFPDAKDWAPVDSFPRSARKKWNKTGTLEIPNGVVKAQLFSWLVSTCESGKGKLKALNHHCFVSHLPPGLLLEVLIHNVSCVQLPKSTFFWEVTMSVQTGMANNYPTSNTTKTISPWTSWKALTVNDHLPNWV